MEELKKVKRVFIKYNPYNLETELTVDEKSLLKTVKLANVSFPVPACRNGLKIFHKF